MVDTVSLLSRIKQQKAKIEAADREAFVKGFDRLKIDRFQFMSDMRAHWNRLGFEWARDEATWCELLCLSNVTGGMSVQKAREALEEANSEMSVEGFFDCDDDDVITDEMVVAFVSGALNMMRAVENAESSDDVILVAEAA